MKFLVFITLAFLMGLSESRVFTEPKETEVAPYSMIDPIIKAILESLRPKLADLSLANINETIEDSKLKASILVKDIMIKNADGFVIQSLKTKVVPLQLTNLTLTWNNIIASAVYDIDINLNISDKIGPLRFFAKGNAGAVLDDILFTIGANFELKNNALQVKPKGLFGFDLLVKKANVTLTSILGNPDLGKSVSVLVSQLIPQLIDTLKKPLFDAYQNDIINIVNKILKNNGTKFMDEEQPFQETNLLDSLELSNTWGSFLGHSFEDNFDLNF